MPDGDFGDPGAYDPDVVTSLASTSSQTFNKTATPFGSTAKREMNVDIFGQDTPGPGRYDPKRPEAQSDTNESVFRSGSTQRPASDQLKTPGAGTYDPDVGSVKPRANNSGASINGKGGRFKTEESMTGDVGPGAYNDDLVKSLAEDSSLAVSRASKKKTGFGATTPQRLLPFS